MTFTQKAETILDLPGGSLSGDVRIEIVGLSHITVDGTCDILEYDPACIRLRTHTGELRINGDALVMDSLHAGGASIGGKLLSLEFL